MPLASPVRPLDRCAREYVRLVLALGAHDPGYVDAWYGPAAWLDEVTAARPSLEEVGVAVDTLQAALEGRDVDAEVAASEPIVALRRTFLHAQVGAIRTRVALLRGTRLTFDQESAGLYRAVSPAVTEEGCAAVVDDLANALPGTGAVAPRLHAFLDRFLIPPDRLDVTFRAAIDEGRRRTLARIALPADESFTLEYVTGKPWGGYNWYQGQYRSLIQVNTDLPCFVDRAVDLACHEGYPGHHVYNVLLEQRLARGRGWVEFLVYPLYSPQSLVAEGTANYGIDVALPPDERLAFERDVIFPAAGLDASEVEAYYAVLARMRRVSYAGNEAARRYLDGRATRAETLRWLEAYALFLPERAEKRMSFIERYRSYVINYNVGQDLVRDYVEARVRDGQDRWTVFEALLATPVVISNLPAAA